MADHKNKKQNETVDAGLCGNEKIEEAIAALQQEPTQEMLAHTLTVIRRRMQENGQFIGSRTADRRRSDPGAGDKDR